MLELQIILVLCLYGKFVVTPACLRNCFANRTRPTRRHLQNSLLIAQVIPEVVFIVGAPGSGKGTQCTLISKEYDFVHINVGELLREESQRPGSEYGEMIDERLRNGKLVPVNVSFSLLCNAMEKSIKKRFLIDGFPRNKETLDAWEQNMSDKTKLLFVLLLECSQDKCTERCLGRGAAGSVRSDDNLECLQKRFQSYLNDTMPIIDHYDHLSLVRRINSESSPQDVYNEVKTVFNDGGLSLSQGDI